MQQVHCQSTIWLDGKVAFITGANTGIGKETALDLASRGAPVILACRDVEKGEEAVTEIHTRVGGAKVEVDHLHILINNAGVMMCPYMKTADGFEMQIEVNHLGHFLLTYLLIGLLKRSAPLRIVVVSSLVHNFGWIRFHDLHSQAATTVASLTARARSNVTVNSGTVKSERVRHSSAISLLFAVFSMFLKTTKEGAQTSIYCTIAEELQSISGKHFRYSTHQFPYD